LKHGKVSFTAGRVDGYKCEDGKAQTFLWDAKTPGLALRATKAGAKSYIFQASCTAQPYESPLVTKKLDN
jgi:hypothetical protein